MAIHFEWTESMSVGEATIDHQHQRLLSQLNKVIDAMTQGQGSEAVKDALEFFEEYVSQHLAYEENYMTVRGFSDLTSHLAKHQYFRDRYTEFKQKLEGGKVADSVLIDIEEFLGKWWIDHIGYEDHKYFEQLGPAV